MKYLWNPEGPEDQEADLASNVNLFDAVVDKIDGLSGIEASIEAVCRSTVDTTDQFRSFEAC